MLWVTVAVVAASLLLAPAALADNAQCCPPQHSSAALQFMRDLFDMLRGAGFKAKAIATVLRAYVDRKSGRSGLPKKEWTERAEPMSQLNAKQLAPVLIAWTRQQQATEAKLGPLWGTPKLDVTGIWPFAYANDGKLVPDFLDEIEAGKLDNGKRLSKTQRAARKECLAWVREQR